MWNSHNLRQTLNWSLTAWRQTSLNVNIKCKGYHWRFVCIRRVFHSNAPHTSYNKNRTLIVDNRPLCIWWKTRLKLFCSPFGRRATFLWFGSIPTCFSFYRELYIFLGFSTCACWMRDKQKPVCMQYSQSIKSHTKIDPSVLSRIANIVNTLVRTCLLNMIRIKRFLSFWPLRNWNKM